MAEKEPVMDLEVSEDEVLDEDDIEVDDDSESDNSLGEDDNNDQEDDDDDGDEDGDDAVDDSGSGEDAEDIPKEAQKHLKKGQKKKTQKRIIGLVNKLKDTEKLVEKLLNAEKERTQREMAQSTESEYQRLYQEKVRAIENQDMDKFAELDRQMFNLKQLGQNQDQDQDQDMNPDEYFRSKHDWYESNDRMTTYAIGVDAKLRSDAYWSNRPVKERLDEVAKRVNGAFKRNPNRKKVVSEGVTSTAASGSKTKPYTKDQMDYMEMAYPNLSRKEKIEMIGKLKWS